MGIDAVEWAVRADKLGAGEILLTSMDCDGTKNGYDIELTRAVSENVSIPVIASGGAESWNIFMMPLQRDGRTRRWQLRCSTLKSWRSERSKSI